MNRLRLGSKLKSKGYRIDQTDREEEILKSEDTTVKRVIYVLTLMLFLAGLIVPAVAHAGNSERLPILTRYAQNDREGSVPAQKSVSDSARTECALHSFVSRLVQLLHWPVDELCMHGPSVKTDDLSTEPERPFFVHRPDWWRPPGPSDRPDMDDGGWDEQIK